MQRVAQVGNGLIVNVFEIDDAELLADDVFVLPMGSLAAPGWLWANGSPVPLLDVRRWWIDVGPFKDRLGIDGMALSASTNVTCQAIKEQLYDRKYVDLKSTQTAQLLGMLMAAVQPAANASFPGAGPITVLKIAAITGTPTTEAERHIKGLS